MMLWGEEAVMPVERSMIFVTFESAFAPLGGLAAVMRVLPQKMAQQESGSCAILTPFFREITKCQKTLYDAIQFTGHHFDLVFAQQSHRVDMYVYINPEGFPTYLIDTTDFFNAPCHCEDPPSLNAPCNPYLTPHHPEQLLQDSLFFCAAVPKALTALGLTKHVVLSLQDWETAATALTVKEDDAIESATCFLTVHNPYDQPITEEDIRQFSTCSLEGTSVLTTMIPFLDGPLSTVSDNFAKELIEDPLHTTIYASHLQAAFTQKGLVGINNGVFGSLDFPPIAIEKAKQGEVQPLLQEKRRRRDEMITILEDYQPNQAWGSLDWAEFEGPVFLFFGRDDPRQKGYDLAAAAIQQIPKGKARFIFTPIPGDEGITGLEFLRMLAEERQGEVKVFPFRMAQGYSELQKGASFLVMCSFYEPFGGATEGYVVGTPVIARATGGLVQQVVPYPARCYSESVRQSTNHFHEDHCHPSGFLFREPDLSEDDFKTGWQTIVDCAYWPHGDRLAERMTTRLFRAMVDEASIALLDAIDLYTNHPLNYAAMIQQGFQMAASFSWDMTVRNYQKLFQSVVK